MLRLLIILYVLIVALAMSAQQKETVYYCYNEQKYIPSAEQNELNSTTAPKDSTSTNSQQYILNPNPHLLHLGNIASKPFFTISAINSTIYSSYLNSTQKVYTILDEYRADLARNLFWQRQFGKWVLVMNGAKGFCDVFSTEYMEKQFNFVSPEQYRKYTVAYSTALKWGTLGAGLNLRTLDLRIFLVSCKL